MNGKLNPNEPPTDVSEVVLGRWNNRIRNICGVLAVLTTCGISIGGIITVYNSVKSGNPWPSDMIMFLLVSGPVVISWSYMNVNKLLGLLFNDKENSINLKDRFAAFIDPNKSSNKESHKE